jgi:hypothetical protein
MSPPGLGSYLGGWEIIASASGCYLMLDETSATGGRKLDCNSGHECEALIKRSTLS